MAKTFGTLDFGSALRSFVGYLEGTQKSAHTIKSYRLDLDSFRRFLTEGSPKNGQRNGQRSGQRSGKAFQLSALGRDDIEGFHASLKLQGLKTNTRRRKLLTVQRFLNFLANRKKLSVELAGKHPTPHKIERVPVTVSTSELLQSIRRLPSETVLDTRNRVLLWTLAETGCLVSEVTRLRFDQWMAANDGFSLAIAGKASRVVPVSAELWEEVQQLQKLQGESPWLFLGFNKFGPLKGPITPRGVEILVKHYAPKLIDAKLIDSECLTPRVFRHSLVLRWLKEGRSRDEIQKLLGLKTAYAFRVFETISQPISKTRTTSTS